MVGLANIVGLCTATRGSCAGLFPFSAGRPSNSNRVFFTHGCYRVGCFPKGVQFFEVWGPVEFLYSAGHGCLGLAYPVHQLAVVTLEYCQYDSRTPRISAHSQNAKRPSPKSNTPRCAILTPHRVGNL